MIVFSSILLIDKTRIQHNREIPVVLDNGINIGSCFVRIADGYVNGQFYLREIADDYSDFYYRISPLQSSIFNKVQRLVVERLDIAASVNKHLEFFN